MAEVDEIRNGHIERVEQKDRVVGKGSIVHYMLSEHEFETLGNNRDYEKYLSFMSMCIGLIIPSIINLFNNAPILSPLGVINLCVISGSLVGLLFSYLEYHSKRKKCNLIYNRLKDQAELIEKG